MADDPKLDPNRYYMPPGVTEPILRPEFAAEEAARLNIPAEAEPDKPASKKRASRKESTSKVARKK